MPRVTIDTTEARSFELAPPGVYPMKVESISAPVTSEKTVYVTVKFKFQDPAMDKLCGTLQRNYPIKGAGAGFIRDFWKAATGEDIPLGGNFDVDTDDAIGRDVLVDVQHREYEGKTYNEPKSVTAYN